MQSPYVQVPLQQALQGTGAVPGHASEQQIEILRQQRRSDWQVPDTLLSETQVIPTPRGLHLPFLHFLLPLFLTLQSPFLHFPQTPQSSVHLPEFAV